MVVLAGTLTSTPSIFNVGIDSILGNQARRQSGKSKVPACLIAKSPSCSSAF
jgi:hypothetical protein